MGNVKIKDVLKDIGACRKSSRKAIKAGSLRRAYERASFDDLMFVLEMVIPNDWEYRTRSGYTVSEKDSTRFARTWSKLGKIQDAEYVAMERIRAETGFHGMTFSPTFLAKPEVRKVSKAYADKLRAAFPFEKVLGMYLKFYRSVD